MKLLGHLLEFRVLLGFGGGAGKREKEKAERKQEENFHHGRGRGTYPRVCPLPKISGLSEDFARFASAHSLDEAPPRPQHAGLSPFRERPARLPLLLGARGGSEEDTGYSQISVFAKAVQLIRQDYVDGKKTSYHDLIYAAMKGMLASLDPHSQFMDPNDFKEMQDDTRSRFNGLGIEVSMKSGLLTVITPMEDTPAAKAGILSGDQILRINGNSTEKMELQDAVNVLRGAARAKSDADDPAAGDEGDQGLHARAGRDQSAKRERREAARPRIDRAVQDRLCPLDSVQRADRG